MSEVATLQFESGRILQSLFGNDLGLLKSLEQSLGVRLTTREGWLRVEGEGEKIQKVRKLFQQLEKARQNGVPIRRQEFQYAMRVLEEPEAAGLDELSHTRLQVSARRAPVIAKTHNQRAYVEAMQAHDIVFGVGPAGTGKTYLAMAAAVSALKQDQVARIILTRPAVEAGEALGFLPGDLREKIMPYLRPLYDALQDMLEPDELQRCLERNTIEIAPLAYMRGRTLARSFVVLDEAQNTTTEQMFMFLTRLGQDSKCVITGDQTQIDLPHNRRSGLVEAIQALRAVPGIGFCHFSDKDVVRHELVAAIIRAYRRHRGSAEPADPRG
jgi:phosphate starvation-inducible PhoH-like protein